MTVVHLTDADLRIDPETLFREPPVVSDNDIQRDNVLDNLEKMRLNQSSAYNWRRYLREIEFDEEFIKEEYETVRAIHKLQETEHCGRKVVIYDPRTGKTIQTRMCKNFDICPKCQAKRKREMKERLKKAKDSGKRVKAKDKKEHKELLDKYGSDNICAVPNEDGGTDMVIETDDDIGEPLTDEDIEELSEQHKKPVEGRKASGGLGKEPDWDSAIDKDEWQGDEDSSDDGEKEESRQDDNSQQNDGQQDDSQDGEKKDVVIVEPKMAIGYRPIVCDPNDPDVNFVIDMAERAVHPRESRFDSLDEVREAIYALETEIIDIAENWGYREKFHILSRKYITVKLSEVYWHIPEHIRNKPIDMGITQISG